MPKSLYSLIAPFALATLFSQAPQALQAQDPKDTGTELREAARKGDLEVVKKAIADKVDLDAPSEYGVTALAMACDHGHESVAIALLEAGANPNVKDKFYKFTPLSWSISKGRVALVERLVQAGADDIDNALTTAVAMQNQKMIDALLKSPKLTTAGKQAAAKYALQQKWDKIAESINEKLPEADRVSAEEPEKPKTESSLAEFAGPYRNEAGVTLTVSVAEEFLDVRSEDSDRPLRLSVESKDKFVARGLEVSFTRDNGKVSSMIIKVGDREQIYKRSEISTPSSKPTEETSIEVASIRDFPLDSKDWPGFRGQLSRGMTGSSLPRTWDGKEGKNIAWKTAIPGLATSSPIAWGDRVFVTTAIQEGDSSGFRVGPYGDVESVQADGECRFVVQCLSLNDGKLIWEHQAAKGVPKVKRHAKSSHANPTPATDGKHLVASFGGEGVFCYDMEGRLLWEKQLGDLDSGWFYDKSYQWGFGSSPCIFEDMVILQCDIQEKSFLTALDLKTGEEKWRTERDEIPTWSSPVAFFAPDGQPTVVVCGTKCSAGYNARTGSLLWKLGGFSEITVPTPQVLPEAVLLTSGYAPVQPIVFLEHSARGDLKMPEEKKNESNSHSPDATTERSPFRWNLMRGGPYMPTPLVVDSKLYVLDNGGILSCYAMGSGKRIFRQRVRSDEANAYTASPISDGQYLLATSESGISFVCDLNNKGEIVAQNALGESVLASPAMAGTKLLIRGEKNLYAIESTSDSK